jgi:putative heme-binding domain-containing protein
MLSSCERSVFPSVRFTSGRPRFHCPPIYLIVGLVCLLSRGWAQHEEHAAPGTSEKPVVFLDKNPRIVAYQLGRLSNAQLLLVDRNATDPKYLPVYQAILTRPGLAGKERETALAALTKLNQSDSTRELLAALKTLPAAAASVAAELTRLLVRQDPNELKLHQAALEELAASEAEPAARQAAFAALAGFQAPSEVWEFAGKTPGGPQQLLGGLLLVPADARRAAYFEKIEPWLSPAQEDRALQAAAIAAAAQMPGHEPAVFERFLRLTAAGKNLPEIARAALRLLPDKWPEIDLKGWGDAVLQQAAQVPQSERTSNDFLDVTQLGMEIAQRLPRAEGLQLRKSLRGLGVHVVRLRTLPEQMFYDKTLLVVEAGKPVELLFENTDVMPHNWVLVLPGTWEEIGLAAEKMAPVPDSQGRLYVPASPKIIQATKLLNPSEKVRFRFVAPTETNGYPYVCTFPGHWQRMRGLLKVVADLDQYLSETPVEPAEPTITEWKLADFTPDLPQVPGRNAAKGKQAFTMAGCISCHKMGSEGTEYGPELTAVFAKYHGQTEAVLAEILEPSKVIEPRYRPMTFKPPNGEPFTGFIVKEEGDSLWVQTGPGPAAIQKFPKKELGVPEPQPLSLMPAGLLNLLTREQILDLLAYLRSSEGAAATAGKAP